jgi:hypothetical protein
MPILLNQAGACVERGGRLLNEAPVQHVRN